MIYLNIRQIGQIYRQIRQQVREHELEVALVEQKEAMMILTLIK
jgi:hypothetical protein